MLSRQITGQYIWERYCLCMSKEFLWWRDGVLGQIYPRSYADSNGDGQGDLPGLASRLPYIQDIGLAGIWLNPINASPNADWGYDVSGYCSIHPDFGTIDDFYTLLASAQTKNIPLILDLVPNHTSDQHPWFVESCKDKINAKRDWYVWADGKDGGPPNNWISMFGGPAWTFDQGTEQWYLHNFTANQPDLNWWNPAVRDAFDDILRFWFDRGVAGFRVDVCQAIVKDALLRDNPPADATDRTNVRLRGQKPMFCMNRPEVHDVLRHWRKIADSYAHKPVLIGETNTHDFDQLALYYGDKQGDELHMAFNFPFMSQDFTAPSMRNVLQKTYQSLPDHAHPIWTMSNHDASRYATRWCQGDQNKVRAAMMLLLCQKGTPMIYYGDELGLEDAPEIDVSVSRDPLALGLLPGKFSRDPCRAPMPWSEQSGRGFFDVQDTQQAVDKAIQAPVQPWLPAYVQPGISVQAQQDNPNSNLHFFKKLVAFRQEHKDLYQAPMQISGDDNLLIMHRGDMQVIVNFSDHCQVIDTGSSTLGPVLMQSQEGACTLSNQGYTLEPWQAVIIKFDAKGNA